MIFSRQLFGARNQLLLVRGGVGALAGIDDLIDQADAMRLLRGDHLARQEHLVGEPLADQARKSLRAAIAGDDAELDLGLSQLALGVARRMVQAMAISQPPPSAKPLMQAITGLPRFSIRLSTCWPLWV